MKMARCVKRESGVKTARGENNQRRGMKAQPCCHCNTHWRDGKELKHRKTLEKVM